MSTTVPPSSTGNPGAQLPDAPIPAGPAPPAPLVAGPGEEVLDFAVTRTRVLFRLDTDTGELFEAAPALPTGLAVEVVALAEQLREASAQADSNGAGRRVGERLGAFLAVFDRILKPESAARFRARLVDVDHPVDPAQLTQVLQGLMGRWGLRPTQPSPGSSPPPPSPADGTSLQDVLGGPASVSAASPSTSS
jgi:hypothetical protein